MTALAVALVALAVVIAFVAVCLAWDRTAPMSGRESLSERHDRLDAEALAANIAAFDRLGKEANR